MTTNTIPGNFQIGQTCKVSFVSYYNFVEPKGPFGKLNLKVSLPDKSIGYIPEKEIAWDEARIPDYARFFGNREAQVIGYEDGKVLLSLRQLQPDPWPLHKTNFPIGAIKKGWVAQEPQKIGFWVSFGREFNSGRVDVEMIGEETFGHFDIGLKKNDEIEVEIIGYDEDQHLILCKPVSRKFDKSVAFLSAKVGQEIEGQITSLVEDDSYGGGVYINVRTFGPNNPLTAYCKREDLAWRNMSKDTWSMTEVVFGGMNLKAIVEEINPATGMVRCSIKAARPNPWLEIEKQYPLGTIVIGCVKKKALKNPEDIYIRFNPDVPGVISKALIGESRFEWLRKNLKDQAGFFDRLMGEWSVKVKVIGYDKENKLLQLASEFYQIEPIQDLKVECKEETPKIEIKEPEPILEPKPEPILEPKYESKPQPKPITSLEPKVVPTSELKPIALPEPTTVRKFEAPKVVEEAPEEFDREAFEKMDLLDKCSYLGFFAIQIQKRAMQYKNGNIASPVYVPEYSPVFKIGIMGLNQSDTTALTQVLRNSDKIRPEWQIIEDNAKAEKSDLILMTQDLAIDIDQQELVNTIKDYADLHNKQNSNFPKFNVVMIHDGSREQNKKANEIRDLTDKAIGCKQIGFFELCPLAEKLRLDMIEHNEDVLRYLSKRAAAPTRWTEDEWAKCKVLLLRTEAILRDELEEDVMNETILAQLEQTANLSALTEELSGTAVNEKTQEIKNYLENVMRQVGSLSLNLTPSGDQLNPKEIEKVMPVLEELAKLQGNMIFLNQLEHQYISTNGKTN